MMAAFIKHAHGVRSCIARQPKWQTRKQEGSLEVLQEVTLCHAVRVFAKVHEARPAQGLWHGRVDEGLQTLGTHGVQHLLHLLTLQRIVPRRKPV